MAAMNVPRSSLLFSMVIALIFSSCCSTAVFAEMQLPTCSMKLSLGLEIHPEQRPVSLTDDGHAAFGQIMRVRCGLGFRKEGRSELECSVRGWTNLGLGQAPTCVPTNALCPPLPEFVRGGFWRLDSAHPLDRFAEDDTAELKCSYPGFVSSDSIISCQLNETSGKLEWSVSKLPTCVPIQCPPVIPASLPSAVVVKEVHPDVLKLAPLSGSSALFRESFRLDCIQPPRRERSGIQHVGANNDSSDPLLDGNFSWSIIRLGPDSSAEAALPPFTQECTMQGQWTQKATTLELVGAKGFAASYYGPEMFLEYRRGSSQNKQLLDTAALPDCGKGTDNERSKTNDLCPPLPFFTNLAIPGWVDNAKERPSNAMPLNSVATLDCGKEFWPESAARNAEHTLPPTAKCVQLFRSRPTGDDEFDDTSSEGDVISRWTFQHGNGSEWTIPIPPTCVPRPMCDPLPTYSGWRLASSLPPSKFYANDKATCTTSTSATEGSEPLFKRRIVTCVSDDSFNAHFEPQLSDVDLECEEVTCPAPGSYPLASRSSQHHTNFIGHIDRHSLIDDDVKLDYFAIGDVLHYSCYYNAEGFHLRCSSTGEWIMDGKPCESNIK